MRCDDAVVAVSLRADDELPAEDVPARLEAHLASCADCRNVEREIRGLRAHLRLEPVDEVPDLGPAVIARLAAPTAAIPASPPGAAGEGEPGSGRPAAGRPAVRLPSPRRRLAVAAALAALAGMATGAVFVGVGTEPRSPAAADLPARVQAAQHDIGSVDSRLTITEGGLGAPSTDPGAAGDGERTFDAHLVYQAPETLALSVHETTPGRSHAGRASGELVVDGDRWWQETTRRCSPAAGLVRCPDEPLTWSRSVSGREPYSDAAPIPLELVSPVDSFSLAAAPTDLGDRTIAGHRAVGVAVTAAQVSPLLDGISAAVALRPVHPADPVELWLDDQHLVPLALVVRAADDPARAQWAASVGAREAAGDVVLRMDSSAVLINDRVEFGAFAIPDGEPSTTVDAGFRAVPPDDPALAQVPTPNVVPDGFRAHRSGIVRAAGGPAVGVRSWSDGRAWLSVRATSEWPGGRLFGDLGLDVRPIDLGTGGAGYASSDGRRIALHTTDLDLVVSGSVPLDQLREVAADLGVVGLTLPPGWAEAPTATLDNAARALPGLLTARDTEGFGAPAVRVDTDADGVATVTEVRSGPGERAFSLTQRRSPVLPPPSAGDEGGVEVRGAAGRYSQQRGEVEWVERGVALSLRSDTLGLGELLAIADRLERA